MTVAERLCRRGEHDLSDPANVYLTPSTGTTQCHACKRTAQRAWEASRVPTRIVVTLRADKAEDTIARFRAATKSRAQDLGTLDGVRRFRVDAQRWAGWTAKQTTRRVA